MQLLKGFGSDCPAIPSLFLPYVLPPNGTESGSIAKTSILEVQAVAPTNNRSWFLGDEVIAGQFLGFTWYASLQLNSASLHPQMESCWL